MLARLNQKEEEESKSSLEAVIDHSGDFVDPVTGDSPDGAVPENQPLENNTSSNKSRGKRKVPERPVSLFSQRGKSMSMDARSR